MATHSFLYMKTCVKCNKYKSFENFSKKSSARDGYRPYCKLCAKYAAEKYKLDKENGLIPDRTKGPLRANTLISNDEYLSRLSLQENVCAICKQTSTKKLAVDHCHLTLKVRGLLCTKCNLGLGLFRDNKQYLESAIEYLNKE